MAGVALAVALGRAAAGAADDDVAGAFVDSDGTVDDTGVAFVHCSRGGSGDDNPVAAGHTRLPGAADRVGDDTLGDTFGVEGTDVAAGDSLLRI